MSRVSMIEQLYMKKKSALEFNYDALTAPPIRAFLTDEDVHQLYKIATSVKYAGDIDTKYNMIHDVMSRRGFRRTHAGTNRVVYECMEIPSVVAKIAIDSVGMGDNPKEFVNQNYFKPFCCKIFEVDPTGVIAFVERVNPITSIEEFASVADDVFNLIVTKIIGKYVLDDIGCDRYMNYGIRSSNVGFGPVLLDFPYAFELDGNKLICNREINTPFGKAICGGEIDYDIGFNNLVCSRCGKIFKARELQLDKKQILCINDDEESDSMPRRARIMLGDKVLKDSMGSTATYISKEQYKNYQNYVDLSEREIIVDKTFHKKQKPAKEIKRDVMIDAMLKSINNKKEDTLADGLKEEVVNCTKSIDKVYKEPEKEKSIVEQLKDSATDEISASSEDSVENVSNSDDKDTEQEATVEDENIQENIEYKETQTTSDVEVDTEQESDEEDDSDEYLHDIPLEELYRMYGISDDDNSTSDEDTDNESEEEDVEEDDDSNNEDSEEDNNMEDY